MSQAAPPDPEALLDRLLRATALLYVAHLVQGGAMKLPLPGGIEDVVRIAATALMAVGVLVGGRLLRRRAVWLAVGVAFFAATASHPDRVGNHHWVLGYFAVALALCCDATAPRMRELVAVNLRWMVAAIMVFAVIQKLASPPMRDGSYIAYMLATGKLLAPVLALCASCGEAIAENRASIAGLATTHPEVAAPVALRAPLPAMPVVTAAVTGVTIGIELLLAALFALPVGRALRLGALLAFVATLGLMRPEWVFAGWLALSGLWLGAGSSRVWAVGFGVVFAVCVALSATRIV